MQRVGVSSHYELMTVQWKRRRCPWLKPPSLWAQKVTTKGEEVSEKKRREIGAGPLLRTFKFKFLVQSRKIKKNKPNVHIYMYTIPTHSMYIYGPCMIKTWDLKNDDWVATAMTKYVHICHKNVKDTKFKQLP